MCVVKATMHFSLCLYFCTVLWSILMQLVIISVQSSSVVTICCVTSGVYKCFTDVCCMYVYFAWYSIKAVVINLILACINNVWLTYSMCFYCFKSPLPVGAGGGYMFKGRPSVPPSVHASVIHVVVLCFRDISSICWRIFAKLLSLVHLGTQMTWLRFWVERSRSHHRGGGAQHSTQLFLVDYNSCWQEIVSDVNEFQNWMLMRG